MRCDLLRGTTLYYTRETKVGIFVLAAVAVLVFMGFYLGVYRFDTGRYISHTLYFKDITGLVKKAEVKIAGVKVGWVDDLSLCNHEGVCVRADLMIDKTYPLHEDAHGVVRQEGLIGPIYLELFQGAPSLPLLTPEVSRGNIQAEQISMEALMRSLHDVAVEMKEIAQAVKASIGVHEQTNQISLAVNGVNQVVDQLQNMVLPVFTESVQTVAKVIDRDFDRFATRVEQTADTLDAASEKMLKGFDEVNTIARDINQGKGFVGSMMHDKAVFNNLCTTTKFLSNTCEKVSNLVFVFDGHIEQMFERASFSCFKNAKGIFNAWIFPRPDYFYLIGVTSSQQGYVTRTLTFPDFVDNCLNQICKADELPEWAKYQYIYNREKQLLKRNAFKIDLQFGKMYKNVALRAGLIEGTAGFAVDLFLRYDARNSVMSTLKMYDFRGQNRLYDERPHLKWINRIFLFDTVYVAFGLDDFVSKCNRTAFLGAGFRFGDSCLENFLPYNDCS
jgi:phospholipid/cholesterol/gamma-HCH transport system substrate-binding protein